MTIKIHGGGGISVDKESIPFYRMLQLRGALRLEIKGIKSRRFSAYAIIKREFGLKGSRQWVLEQFCQLVEEESAKQERVEIE